MDDNIDKLEFTAEESRELLAFVEGYIHRRKPKRAAPVAGQSRVTPFAGKQREEMKRFAVLDLYNAIKESGKQHDELTAGQIAHIIFDAISRGSIRGVGIVNREEGQ